MTRRPEIDLDAIQQRVPAVYEAWAPSHADGLLLTLRPYSPEDEYQKIENVRIEPEISLEMAQFLGKAGLGESSYSKLLAGLDEQNIEALVMDRHKQRKNTLISTLHLRNVLDTASTHNGLFVVSGGNPEIAQINDVIANPMMAYLNIGGIAVYKALAVSGGIDEALPYEAAKSYGMDKEARMYLARRMREALEDRLEKGVAISWSLPGTRGKKVILEDGSKAIVVPEVKTVVAEFAVKQLGLAVPVPIDLHPGSSNVEVLLPRELETIDDVHLMMEEMVEAAGNLSGEQIIYRMPEGAVPADV